MIKFFRNIRQRLLTENKFSKYLVYAIGEIILVVIGILIALQINNWNEENKTTQRQKNYLALIKTEMTNNLDALHVEKQRLNELLEGLREFVSMSDQPFSEISEKQLSSSWGKVFSKTIRFKNENGALKELISTGALKEIKNDDIRNILASWEGRNQKLLVQENEVNSYIRKGNDYLEKNGNVRVIIDENNGNAWWQIERLPKVKSNKFLLEAQEFENILVFAIGTGQALHDSFYKKLQQDIESLIGKIDNELNQKEADESTEGKVLLDGQLHPNLYYGVVTSEGALNWYSENGSFLCMDYPENQQWGVLYITIGEPTATHKLTGDYSKYEQLVIEMQGKQGGEQIQVAIKDAKDPDDGSEDKKLIELTKEWKTFKIDIKDNFKSADLKNLFVVTSFIFGSESQNICVRKIYFE